MKANRKGFSFMEVMIVVAIIGIMTVIVLVSQQNSRNRRYLEIAGRELSAAMQELQNNALTGKQVSTGQTICGYGIRIYNNANAEGRYLTYDLFYNFVPDSSHSCSGVESGTTPVPKEYDDDFSNVYSANNVFGKNVSSTSAAEVYFSIPHANAFGEDGNTLPANYKISLSHPSLSQSYPICIYSGGRVEEMGIGSTSNCPN